MKEAVIVAAVRTPLGAFGGSLKDVSAVDLGSLVIKSAIERANLKPEQVDEVIMGNVLGAGLGQNVARQMSVNAGIPVASPAFTINKVCGSGLKAVQLAAQAVLCGDADIVVAGGAENMSQAPYVVQNQRWGSRMGDSKVVDTMLRDGLTDGFEGFHMGITAENVSEQYGITREDQDNFAVQSQKRAVAAIEAGRFKEEIVPVEIPQRRGEPIVFDTDEFPRKDASFEGLSKLRPVFKKDGTARLPQTNIDISLFHISTGNMLERIFHKRNEEQCRDFHLCVFNLPRTRHRELVVPAQLLHGNEIFQELHVLAERYALPVPAIQLITQYLGIPYQQFRRLFHIGLHQHV